MKRNSVFALILPLIVLSACGPAERPRTAGLPCLAFKAISFAQLSPGETNDPGNKADSDQTVAEIIAHNARYESLCSTAPRDDAPG